MGDLVTLAPIIPATIFVIPAQAEIHGSVRQALPKKKEEWIPACAGMTEMAGSMRQRAKQIP